MEWKAGGCRYGEREKGREREREGMLKYKKKRLEDKIRKSKVETKCIIEMYGNDDDGVAKEGRGHYEQ